MRILVVEDEPRLAGDVVRVLTAAGFVVEVADNGEDAWFLGDTEDYAGIILDLGLPKLDGLSVLKRWREGGMETPVLILTSRASWNERVTGIDAGADDYLPKPFQMEELIARLHAIIRRSAGKSTSAITLGPLTVDARQMKVMVEGVPVSLTPLEYRALTHLMYNAGTVIAPHELVEHVYGAGTDREANTLEVLIGRLRKKLGASLIETRRGFGYIIPEPDK
ncbi:MAG: response regulator transcription factor [Rhizobiaceae bacterium]